MILKLIHDTNMRARGQPEKVFTVSTAPQRIIYARGEKLFLERLDCKFLSRYTFPSSYLPLLPKPATLLLYVLLPLHERSLILLLQSLFSMGKPV